MEIHIPPLAMYAAMKANGLEREEMNLFAHYLERQPDEESPRGTMLEFDVWFDKHIRAFRRTRSENPLFKKIEV